MNGTDRRMRRMTRRAAAHLALIAGASVVAAGAAVAGGTAGGAFDLSWHTMDGGGGASAGGAFDCVGTVAQHDAEPVLAGGGFTLTGGFWGGMPTGSCLGDLDGDSVVTAADLALLLGEWGTANPAADLDGSGLVDAADLAILLGGWNGCA